MDFVVYFVVDIFRKQFHQFLQSTTCACASEHRFSFIVVKRSRSDKGKIQHEILIKISSRACRVWVFWGKVQQISYWNAKLTMCDVIQRFVSKYKAVICNLMLMPPIAQMSHGCSLIISQNWAWQGNMSC